MDAEISVQNMPCLHLRTWEYHGTFTRLGSFAAKAAEAPNKELRCKNGLLHKRKR